MAPAKLSRNIPAELGDSGWFLKVQGGSSDDFGFTIVCFVITLLELTPLCEVPSRMAQELKHWR